MTYKITMDDTNLGYYKPFGAKRIAKKLSKEHPDKTVYLMKDGQTMGRYRDKAWIAVRIYENGKRV